MSPALGWSGDDASSDQDNRIAVRRGGSKVGTEKSDTLIHDVPADWARRAHEGREIRQHVPLGVIDAAIARAKN
ncbi:MAG: hypothetical protein ACJ8FZ_20720 [Bradyrhizobium sp.]|jgi:hypothetical protein